MRPLYQLLLGRVGISQQGHKWCSLSLSLSISLSLFKILSSESMMILYDKVMSPCALL